MAVAWARAGVRQARRSWSETSIVTAQAESSRQPARFRRERSMERITLAAYGGPEQLTLQKASPPDAPGPNQLLVDVEAAGVNYIDVMQREGTIKLPLPCTPGLEGVGRVRAIGSGIHDVDVGQPVAWVYVPGSYATQLLVPASAKLFQALTAQYLVAEYRDVGPGDRVLVHSAAGGVGQPACAVVEAPRRLGGGHGVL
jgi:NADPH:quinone reductase-like Zn-dependent oxidoreductase